MGCDGPRCELARGLAGDFSFQVLDRDGNEYTSLTTPFLATDTLSCDIWTGDDQAALATITPTWLDADLAQYQVSFAASDSTDWEIGDYQGIVTATRSGRTGPIGRFTLTVKAAPGSATEAVCFTQYQDLLLYAPWIGEVQACADQARFQEQQSRATTRLIDALCQRWKTQVVWDISRTTLVAWGTGVEPSDWLRQQLVPLIPTLRPPSVPTQTIVTDESTRPCIDASLAPLPTEWSAPPRSARRGPRPSHYTYRGAA
jgi:hypothetical protein